MENIFLPSNVGVASSLSIIRNSALAVVTAPSAIMEDITGRLSTCGGVNVIIGISGNFRHKDLGFLASIVKRRLPSAPVITLSNPSRTRRITHGVPASVITASGSLGTTRTMRDVVSKGYLEICATASLINIRLNNTVGGIVTVTTNFYSNLKLNSGSGTTVVAQKLTRVAELNVYVNTGRFAFTNLANINSLIIAYASHRDHGGHFNCVINDNVSVSATLGRINAIRNCCTTRVTCRLNGGCGVRLPVMGTYCTILCRKGGIYRIPSRLVGEPGNDRRWVPLGGCLVFWGFYIAVSFTVQSVAIVSCWRKNTSRNWV